jgi:hypothetical protein
MEDCTQGPSGHELHLSTLVPCSWFQVSKTDLDLYLALLDTKMPCENAVTFEPNCHLALTKFRRRRTIRSTVSRSNTFNDHAGATLCFEAGQQEHRSNIHALKARRQSSHRETDFVMFLPVLLSGSHSRRQGRCDVRHRPKHLWRP